jgi:excisionase family DNA binding protein
MEDVMDRLLTVDEAAAMLGTTTRFPRRLIAERRIKFVRLGRHVRISERELEAVIDAGTVNAVSSHVGVR